MLSAVGGRDPRVLTFAFEFQMTMEKGNRLTICCPKLEINSTCQGEKQIPHHVRGLFLI